MRTRILALGLIAFVAGCETTRSSAHPDARPGTEWKTHQGGLVTGLYVEKNHASTTEEVLMIFYVQNTSYNEILIPKPDSSTVVWHVGHGRMLTAEAGRPDMWMKLRPNEMISTSTTYIWNEPGRYNVKAELRSRESKKPFHVETESVIVDIHR